MNLKLIITGASGMVGNGILHVCLDHPGVEKILVINRKSIGISNPKLEEIIHQDFSDLSSIENQLKDYDACFYCIGVTSLFIKEFDYYKITHNLTLSFANSLSVINPYMVFCYVSGYGADFSGKAKLMQARIKGLTEKDLLKTSFKNVYSFRPGLLKPVKGQKYIHVVYHLFNPFYSLFRYLLPKFILSLNELALAMIKSAAIGYEKQILEVTDIKLLSCSETE